MVSKEIKVGDYLITRYGYPYLVVAIEEQFYRCERNGMTLLVKKDGSEAMTQTGSLYDAEFFDCREATLAKVFESLVRTIEIMSQEIQSLKGWMPSEEVDEK